MKRILSAVTACAVMAALLAGCGGSEKKLLHCDECGKVLTVSADSAMEENWIIYCSDCERELGLDQLFS